MARQGKLVTLVILFVALAAAASNLMYQKSRVHRSLDFWGPATAALIVGAPQADVLRLASDGGAKSIVVQGRRMAVVDRKPAADARGFINIRRGLVSDESFAWDDGNDCQPSWSYAIVFRDGDQQATLLFALDCPRAMLLDGTKRVSTRPIAEGLREFFDEQLQKSPP